MFYSSRQSDTTNHLESFQFFDACRVTESEDTDEKVLERD